MENVKSLDAASAYDQLTVHAEQIKNDCDHVCDMTIGESWAQGDVLLTRIKAVPKGASIKPTQLQVVDGNTQGSRHIWAHGDGVTMHVLSDANALEGPVYELSQPNELTHPEHGNISVQPGVYAIEYQRTYAEELRRVAD